MLYTHIFTLYVYLILRFKVLIEYLVVNMYVGIFCLGAFVHLIQQQREGNYIDNVKHGIHGKNVRQIIIN